MTGTYSGDALHFFTVYRDPSDFPGLFVVRRHEVTRGESFPRELVATGDSLETVRAAVPFGAVNLGRYADDDPKIVESWTMTDDDEPNDAGPVPVVRILPGTWRRGDLVVDDAGMPGIVLGVSPRRCRRVVVAQANGLEVEDFADLLQEVTLPGSTARANFAEWLDAGQGGGSMDGERPARDFQQPRTLEDMQLFAHVGPSSLVDEAGTIVLYMVGLTLDRTTTGEVADRMQTRADRTGKPVYLCRFVLAEILHEFKPGQGGR